MNNLDQRHQAALNNLNDLGITPMREILSCDVFLNAQDKSYRDDTILIPEVVFWLMSTVALQKQSMIAAISQFWTTYRSIWQFPKETPVTEEAFCTARKKLKLRFFKRVFNTVIQRYQSKYSGRFTWRGFRLLGIDGMKITLPPSAALKGFFPPASNQKGVCKTSQGLLVGLVGLFDGLCYGFKLTSSKGSEQMCARHLIQRYVGKGDLLLCDKNFPDHETIGLLASRGANFLFRLQEKRFDRYPRQKIASDGPDQWVITLELPPKLQRQHPDWPKQIKTRVIRYQISGFRPSLLITSLLDTENYTCDSLIALYHERWRQETMHREWKYSLTMDNFRSHQIRGIFKEVYVQLTVNNVLRWIMADAVADSNLRPVDLQYLESKRTVLRYYHLMSAAPIHDLQILYKDLLAVISSHKILIRPGRSYPRPGDNKSRCKGYGVYVPPSRLQKRVS